MNHKTLPGKTYPLGARVEGDGVNFCLYSKHAHKIELLLFKDAQAGQPHEVIELEQTYHYWHIWVKGIGSGQIYGYRVHGDFKPEEGLRFDPSKVLLDPYAHGVVGQENYDRNLAKRYGQDNCYHALKSVVIDMRKYNWGDDDYPRIPLASTVIYEMHVGGFTRRDNSGVAPKKRGTYAGLIEKIPYLKKLGVTAVELLPVHQFDERDVIKEDLENYWGYDTVSFFAPHRGYSSDPSILGPVNEFRDMVKALHKAGIEVILDVVFNHTAEGNEAGPTLNFKGIDNPTYYILEEDLVHYKNYSGCGNTFKANHPVCNNLIIDALRFWVSEMHVDGFRFDLASILGRDIEGEPEMISSVLDHIETDPVLAGTKLIAEAWDAAGLYQVGHFVNFGDWFGEWNGPFRDDVRRFVRGEGKTVKPLAARFLSSSDIYTKPDREPNHSIHFVTCHDGFTLHDLVSYDKKHNEANGEENRDGANDNYSWNCGVEGYTDDPKIINLRIRQMKNLWLILLLAQGTPMMLMGDEVARSQNGNNNAYCQNNELSWFNWDDVNKNSGLLRYVQKTVGLIQHLEIFQQEQILKTYENDHEPYLVWHGTRLFNPDFTESSHSIAFTLHHPQAQEFLYGVFNAYWEGIDFDLPQAPHGKQLRCVIDTYNDSPHDFQDLDNAPVVNGHRYYVRDRSCILLMAK
uniref:GlgX n=1 Tax=Cyanobacterium sp. CLg1 TaxID=197335 RepID=M4WNB2_9CHRO|nr:GlgX [Cyanobacterium sp. CLg1]